MNNLKSFLAAGALALGFSTAVGTSAQAVTFTPNVNNSFDVVFDWQSTPFSEETDVFSVAFDFNFSLESYTGTGSQQTGFYLDQIDGSTVTRLTTATDACANATWGAPGRCNLITASTPDGSLLFGNLSAGSQYRIGVYDSATPFTGTLAFDITKVAPVPLPAAGFMLIGALGGMAAMRRRKKTA